MPRLLTFRQTAAIVVGAVGLEEVFSAATPDEPTRHKLIEQLALGSLASLAHLLALVVGLAMVVGTPKLWRGTRRAAALTVAGLLALALLNIIKGLDYEETALDLCLAAMIVAGRRAFPLGSGGALRLRAPIVAVGAWALTYTVLLTGPLVSDRGHTIARDFHKTIAHTRFNGSWLSFADLLLGCAVLLSMVAVRSVLRPADAQEGHTDDEEMRARAILSRYGDSLSPFALRPDKSLHFSAEGMLAYRVLGATAVISGDPVGPPGTAPEIFRSFREMARRRGWTVVVWGASAEVAQACRACGMHAVRGGEEAFVDPATFTLEGRRVRKLRQSVHRVTRRGWSIEVYEGRQIKGELEEGMARLEAKWRGRRRRIRGFAMSMGPFEPLCRPDDLYVLGRSPRGELQALMRLASYPGGLSLDTMRRVGETPNGLNEAMLARALETARLRGVTEVSLNYAGLAHLVRGEFSGPRPLRRFSHAAVGVLGRHFQMSRLVRFDEKFQPVWRSRHLVYESRTSLPRAVVRVLQVEGYLPEARRPRLRPVRRIRLRALPDPPQVDAAQ